MNDPTLLISNKKKRKYVKDRFNYLVIKQEGCWGWKGSIIRNNYGTVKYENKNLFSHRVSWIIYKGEIPKGMLVCHSCDNPICTNPEHLFLGTYKDNMQDMIKKGRAGWQKKKMKEN